MSRLPLTGRPRRAAGTLVLAASVFVAVGLSTSAGSAPAAPGQDETTTTESTVITVPQPSTTETPTTEPTTTTAAPTTAPPTTEPPATTAPTSTSEPPPSESPDESPTEAPADLATTTTSAPPSAPASLPTTTLVVGTTVRATQSTPDLTAVLVVWALGIVGAGTICGVTWWRQRHG